MDFSWFLTIPGMLITGGVLLLIIALIIFITTSSKKPKEKKPENNQTMAPNPINDLGSSPVANPQPVGVSVNPSTSTSDINIGISSDSNLTMDSNDIPNDIAIPLENNINQDLTSSSPISNSTTSLDPSTTDLQASLSKEMSVPSNQEQPINSTISSVDSMSQPVGIESTQSAEFSTPTSDLVTETPSNQNLDVSPVVDSPLQNAAVMPMENPVSVSSNNQGEVVDAQQVQPTVQSEVTPVVSASVQEVSPVVEIPVAKTPEVVPAVSPVVSVKPQEISPIYGGADPSISVAVEENNNHQIYGGADPLENTQIIPVQQPAVEPVVPNLPTDNPAVVPVENSNHAEEVNPLDPSISNV